MATDSQTQVPQCSIPECGKVSVRAILAWQHRNESCPSLESDSYPLCDEHHRNWLALFQRSESPSNAEWLARRGVTLARIPLDGCIPTV